MEVYATEQDRVDAPFDAPAAPLPQRRRQPEFSDFSCLRRSLPEGKGEANNRDISFRHSVLDAESGGFFAHANSAKCCMNKDGGAQADNAANPLIENLKEVDKNCACRGTLHGKPIF